MTERKTKVNCWDFKKCGRQPGGTHNRDLGVCPATMERRLDGEHNGTNAGRSCWVIAGTLCKGEIQGTFAQKFNNCEICDFYRLVKSEEHPRFNLSATLLAKLRG
jgi:hypothetical protein